MAEEKIYGLMAEYKSPEELIEAAKKITGAGYQKVEGYSPFPIEELEEALKMKKTKLPFLVFIGGVIGGCTGFFMQYFASVINYPLNIGGKPLNSWPTFIPITFELSVLFAAFTGVFGMFWLNHLPEPYHPVFNVDRFENASKDRFFLCVESKDRKFDLKQTEADLSKTNPEVIEKVSP